MVLHTPWRMVDCRSWCVKVHLGGSYVAIVTLATMSNIAAERAFVSVAHIATLLDVSPQSVRRLIHSRALPAVRLGKSYRVRQADLTDFLVRQSTADAR